MSCPVELVKPSGFRVNNIGPNSFTVSKSTITFHDNTSPAVPGVNTIHIVFPILFSAARCRWASLTAHSLTVPAHLPPLLRQHRHLHRLQEIHLAGKSPPNTAPAPVIWSMKTRRTPAIRFTMHQRMQFLLFFVAVVWLSSVAAPADAQVNVTQFHNHDSRDGLYIDSAFTPSAAAKSDARPDLRRYNCVATFTPSRFTSRAGPAAKR